MANAWKEINTEPSASQEKDSRGGWIANQIPIGEAIGSEFEPNFSIFTEPTQFT